MLARIVERGHEKWGKGPTAGGRANLPIEGPDGRLGEPPPRPDATTPTAQDDGCTASRPASRHASRGCEPSTIGDSRGATLHGTVRLDELGRGSLDVLGGGEASDAQAHGPACVLGP